MSAKNNLKTKANLKAGQIPVGLDLAIKDIQRMNEPLFFLRHCMLSPEDPTCKTAK
ncbi:MAG: hypothetical protein NTZ74_16565 [Chloroflexi bacterium]|nr:hypothetical protein [Chloroflexota bacterium]